MMATKLSVSGELEQNCREDTDHSLYTSVVQKKSRLGIKDNRPSAIVQQHLLGMIRQTKSTGTTSAGVIQARVPNYDALCALKDHLPVDIIKEKLTVLIEDLKLVKSNIPTWVRFIVKPDGSIDQTSYNNLFRKDDPKIQYKDPKLAESKINDEDIGKFQTLLRATVSVVNDTKTQVDLIGNVFGTKLPDAIDNYGKIQAKIEEIEQKNTVQVTTDYNGDDEQLGIGGYADFQLQKVHFRAELINAKEGRSMIIHECAHLIDNSIVDQGYYGSPGFENMSDEDKLHNAAHYEVVPQWILGTACYPKGMNFSYIPPGTMGKEEEGERLVSEYFRQAWASGANHVRMLRERVGEALNPLQKTSLIDFSRAMGLSVHYQTDPVQTDFCQVTLLDVVLMERIVRKVNEMKEGIAGLSENIAQLTDADAVKEYFITETLRKSEYAGIDRTMLNYLIDNPNAGF